MIPVSEESILLCFYRFKQSYIRNSFLISKISTQIQFENYFSMDSKEDAFENGFLTARLIKEGEVI